MTPTCEIIIADVRAGLRQLRERRVSVQCVVTSPPYWGLRSYSTTPQVWGGKADCAHEWRPAGTRHRGGPQGATGDRATRDTSAQDATGDVNCGAFCDRCTAWLGELGLEPTPHLYVRHMVHLFRLVRPILAENGTLWLNLGDCYADGGRGEDTKSTLEGGRRNQEESRKVQTRRRFNGVAPKNMIGAPWRVALALQADGWTLRRDIIWHKDNPMPESTGDRPTTAHEYVFLLSKSARYFYDRDAAREAVSGTANRRSANDNADTPEMAITAEIPTGEAGGVNPKAKFPSGWERGPGSHDCVDFARPSGGDRKFQQKQNPSFARAVRDLVETRNWRSVWKFPTEAYKAAHYATFPRELPRRCIAAGSRPGDTVLDIFGGSGTVGEIALEYGRNAILIDLDPKNEALMRNRIARHVGQGVLATDV